MGMIIQDIRPRDWAYGAEFYQEDLPYLYQMASIIRQQPEDNNKLLESYYEKCQKKVDDHKPVITISNKNIEFIQVVKSDDIAVTTGLQQYINLVLGISSTRWRYIGYGNGGTTANPSVGDSQLNAEYSGRIDTSALGWARVAGLKMMFGGIVGETISASPTNEMGVFNASSGGIMLNHNHFNQIALSRSIGKSAFILSSVYQLSPRA
jgi:hypothetical protein